MVVPLPHPPLLWCLLMQYLNKRLESICVSPSQSFLPLRKEGTFVLWAKTHAEVMAISWDPGHALQSMGPAARISDQDRVVWTNLQLR